MSNFVTLKKKQFEALLPANFNVVDKAGVKEVIYELDTKAENVAVRIYSTVDVRTGQTRDIGKDAIRVVFWDSKNDRPLGKGKKILRVEGATTIEERITQRIEEFMATAQDQDIIDFDYVRAVLEANSWNDFAMDLLGNLEIYKSLTEKQLVYVLGEENPRGKQTFEAMAKKNNPDFWEEYLEEEENYKDPTDLPQKDEKLSNGNPFVDQEELERVKSKLNRKENKDEKTDFKKGRGDNSDNTHTSSEAKNLVGSQERKIELSEEKEAKIRDDGEYRLIKASLYPCHKYPFEEFNPIQSAIVPFAAEDKNLIVGSSTGSGKTIVAELLIDCVDKGKKIIYTAPLKALSSERFEDWKERYSDKKVVMLTGDTLYSKKERTRQMMNAAEADILIMTSELLDSITRHYDSEKYYFLQTIALLIVDEAHLITMEGRGHVIESAIVRFVDINPEAKVCFLSATMSNLDELASWLTQLNKKKTRVVSSPWRPVPLDMNYVEYLSVAKGSNGYIDYGATQEIKEQLAVDLVMSKPDEKWLCFVHAKNTGRNIIKKLAKIGVESQFHNADLDKSKRKEIEDSFKNRDGGLRVLISTSTIAIGVNMPARNVVIVGVHRGIKEVDELDIVQECGRAGRPQFDDQGFAYLLVPAGATSIWKQKIENPRPVTSTLNDDHFLAFHVVAEIDIGNIKDGNTLLEWYERTLACRQERKLDVAGAEVLFDRLKQIEMIEGDISVRTTGLGKVSSWLYYSPYSIYQWYCNFGRVISNGDSIDDLSLAWALGDIEKNDIGYVSKNIASECEQIKWDLRSRGLNASNTLPSIVAYYYSLKGRKSDNTELNAITRNLTFDIERTVQALSLMDGMYAKWNQEMLWQTLPLRIKYGVGEEMLELVKIPGVGGKRAQKMWSKGIKTLEDVANNRNKKTLASMFSAPFVVKIQRQARELTV